MSDSIHQRVSMCRMLLRLAVVVGFAALTGLVSTNPAPARADACPTSNPPNTMVLVGGTPQTAKLYQPFAETLQVTLANTNGCPITTQSAGTPVTFAAPSSGAGGTFSASGSNTLIVGTNAAGAASASEFVANGSAGSYSITATSTYGSVSFSLTNTASGIAATIMPAAAQSQSATTGSRYPQPLQATVHDANGNPVEGASVTFTLGASTGAGAGAAAAGASFDGGSAQAIVRTNASGTATSALFTANTTAGTFTATASTGGVVEPAVFTLDNLAGRPPTISALAPAKQSATIGRRYGKPLQVKVLDGNGNPLQGATVTFSLGTATSGGGGGAGGSASAGAGASFVDGSSVVSQSTDAAGVATSPRFTANTTAGRFTATATTTGTTEAATFSLDNLAGRTPSITNIGTSKRSATVGARYAKPLQVKVRDGSGRPMQGASVTFALGASAGAGPATSAGATFAGGSSQATELTNASGIATSPRLTANTTAGIFTATATTTGTTRAASFALHNRPGKPAMITAGVAATASTALGTRFPVRLAVTITDKNGNTVAGIAVRFTAPASGASGRFNGQKRVVTVKTDAKGVAVAPPFVANRTPGGYVVTATARRRAAAFALVNQPVG
jgi:protocatechuate 3,4-dioxygenase beta subunit